MHVFGIDLDESQIRILRPGITKPEALDALIDAVAQNPVITDREAFRKAVFEREAVMSTGIGGGVALPHVRIPSISRATIGIGIAQTGIDYGTLDDKPVYVLILFATPEGAEKVYLGLLAQVMKALRNDAFFERLKACTSPEEVLGVLAGA